MSQSAVSGLRQPDYRVRTTNRDVPQCRNLPVDVANIPKYPRDMYPQAGPCRDLLPGGQ
jgi:hypothetical protein